MAKAFLDLGNYSLKKLKYYQAPYLWESHALQFKAATLHYLPKEVYFIVK